jgi:4-aminobutyrate aminotransferase/(S)-3-amino-2-methylpropionate transaminase
MDGPHPGGLGGTYSGNPLACVAAVEAIQMMRQPAFLTRATEVGQRIRGHLEAFQAKYDIIGDVRGLGPMLAMELVRDRVKKTPAMEETNQLTQETLKRGLITLRAGLYSNCVRFLPPLNLTDAEIDEGMSIVGEALKQL